jgi:hypothetical protein
MDYCVIGSGFNKLDQDLQDKFKHCISYEPENKKK